MEKYINKNDETEHLGERRTDGDFRADYTPSKHNRPARELKIIIMTCVNLFRPFLWWFTSHQCHLSIAGYFFCFGFVVGCLQELWNKQKVAKKTLISKGRRAMKLIVGNSPQTKGFLFIQFYS